jgi:hypothetical protein
VALMVTVSAEAAQPNRILRMIVRGPVQPRFTHAKMRDLRETGAIGIHDEDIEEIARVPIDERDAAAISRP